MTPMARRSPPPAPRPAEAPLPAEITWRPAAFARALAPTEPALTRYLAAPGVAALLSGVAYALLVRPAVNLAAPGSFTFSTHLTNVMGGVFLGLFAYLIQWGLGYVATRRAGRPAEVYAATHTLTIPLYLLVAVLAVLAPAPVVPPGTPETGVERAALHVLAGGATATLYTAVAVLGTVAQAALAFVAFRTLTGSVGRALAGALLPLLPAAAVQFINAAPLFFNR